MSFENFNQEDNKLVRAMDLRNEKKNKNMRELKFKVWDNVDYMSEPFTFQDVMMGVIEFTFDCTVMRYIGLKDKNFVEIYEDDICTQTFGGETNVGKVSLEATRGAVVGNKPIWPHDIEIIGNIYQNPNLLK